jgi:hypothetical protein
MTWSQFVKILSDILKFVERNKDALAGIGVVGVFLVWLLPKTRGLWKRLRTPRPSVDPFKGEFPFSVIPPSSKNVLQQLMPSSGVDSDPLASFRIPYQERSPSEATPLRNELEQELRQTPHRLLILGRRELEKLERRPIFAKFSVERAGRF